MPKASQKSTPRLVVGVGASAGGLSEFKTLVKSLSEKSGMAFILVQHLEPSHKSMLPELLERETEIPVSAASDGLKLESDHIYVIPPNCYIELNEGTIHLT